MTEILEVELIHFYPLENSSDHHTDKYELVHSEPAIPVLRRGQGFNVAIRFINRSYDSSIDIVRIFFNIGPQPNTLKGTKGVVRLTDKTIPKNSKLWFSKITSNSDNTLMVEIFSPVDAPVGAWQVQVETRTLNSTIPPQLFDYDQDVFILFNPWHKDDTVYMSEEKLLDEYILTDVGKIWVGPFGSSRGREWIFGQFDATVLHSTMLMLERANIAWSTRGDPVKITRTISKMVNSNDDQGVLIGSWDGEYKDGTPPSAWTGSVAILEQFLETEESVPYGQCWVFAGVVTTICRALGIPSRVVSNLVSAHDANASLSVDRYYNADNEEMDYDPLNPNGEDSIWNYHVWNDVWMARLDLPKGYGGWQVIDATPQETSGGFYQCGPASLEAIKQGAVGYNYDVAFMLASVNADIMRWKEDSTCDSGYSKIQCNKYHIGRMILTKRPYIYDPNGDKDREDITLQYKAKEGTEAERLALYNGVRAVELAKSFYALPDANKEDVEFDLVELERINIGENFSLTVTIKNNSKEFRNVKVELSAGSMFYTGVKANVVKRASGSFKIKPNNTEKLTMTVTVDEYGDKLVEYCIMKLYAIATVTETRQTWADEDDFQVLKPSIAMKMSGDPVVGKNIKVRMNFINPLKKTLTNCKFYLAGPGVVKNRIIPYRDINPNENIVCYEEFAPLTVGDKKLISTFSSRELVDITGSIKINIDED